MEFDPMLVSKINEKKLTAPGSPASSLLSEPKLRGVVENARIILKVHIHLFPYFFLLFGSTTFSIDIDARRVMSRTIKAII